MSASPRLAESARLVFEVTIDGEVLPATCPVVEVKCCKEINRIPFATISILDGSMTKETFALSEDARFLPGKPVVLKAGYVGKSVEQIFKGIITRHAIKVRRGSRSLLTLTCHDEAVRLTTTRRSVQYTAMTDTAVIKKLIADCGLSADVDAGTDQNPQMIQYAARDWDYIILRAETLGCVVVVDDGTVSVKTPAFDAAPLIVSYGESLSDADLELDARSQITSVSAIAWDPSSQSVLNASSSEPGVNTQSDVKPATLAAVIGKADTLLTPAPLAEAGLKTWADGHILRNRLARIRGCATFHGSALAKVGSLVTLQGLGTRFDGDAYISRVTQTIKPNVWRTEVGLGLTSRPFATPLAPIDALPAAGLLPAATGLQIGKVQKIHEDPDGHFRIKVSMPLITTDADGLWARYATPYAGSKTGVHFLPELDDEVVIGFLNGDPSSAVVLGSLHSSANVAPYTPDEKNTFKGLVTSSQLKLWFDDQKKIVTLETPGGHNITLSDDAASVTIVDSNKNKIVLDGSGIKATSNGDFVIDVLGNVTISGKKGITLDTPADLAAKGANIGFTASMQLTAKGQLSAQLTSPVEAVVKGAVVMIN